MLIPYSEPNFPPTTWDYVKACLDSGWVSPKGAFVARFEEAFAQYVSARFAIATHSGTAALHLAVAALGLGAGDEVIVPALTYVATASVVTYVGATPVFVDVDANTGTIDPQHLAKQITPRTKAIMVVHLYGYPAAIDSLLTIAHQHNLPIIEDSAGAIGARYQGQHVGTWGTIGCFSFYANKLITTGSGGMLVTNDETIAQQVLRLCNHAHDPPGSYLHDEIGFNYRLTAMQAALGLSQLEEIETLLQLKHKHAHYYRELLTNIAGVKQPLPSPNTTPSYGSNTIRLTAAYPLTAAVLAQKLREQGVETRPYFMPLKDLPPFQDCPSAPLPVARQLRQVGLNLPSSTKLTTSDIEWVVATIAELGETA